MVRPMHPGSPPETFADGRYERLAVLGQGGCATVYRVLDRSLRVERALKVLDPSVRADEQQRARFLAEARTMARLRHPHVLAVHDIGTEDGADFFVMDLAEGGSLADRLAAGGALPPAEAIVFTIQVLAALGAAHQAGIVHRDVKPQNVLLHGSSALLADFGIALVTHEHNLRTTRTGAVMGSFAFMAPEQRLDARDVGPTADLYATAATLFALVTNANPVDLFAADESSVRWDAVPPPLVPVLRRATRLEPAARYGTAQALAEALAAVAEDLEPGTSERLLQPTLWAPVPMGPTPAGFGGRRPAAPVDPTAVDATPPVAPAEPAARRRWGPAVALALLVATAGVWIGWPGAPGPGETLPPTTVTIEPPQTLVPPAPDPAEVTTPDPAEAPSLDLEEAPEAPPAVAPPAAPQPVLATAQPPPSPAATTPPLGAWSGSFGGRVATLRLAGSPEALHGQLEVRFGGNAQVSEVVGSYDHDGRVLSLRSRDPEAYDAGSYTAELTPAEDRMSGRFTTLAGDRAAVFGFSRAP